VIALSDKPVVINAPEDPELASVWALAVGKFTTQMGREPETREDARHVIAEYERLLAKPHGSLGRVVERLIEERCSEVRSGD
jgi:hypothetical protein